VPRPTTGTIAATAAACALAAVPAAASTTADGVGPLLVLTAGRLNAKHPEDGPSGGGVEYRSAPLGRWKLIPGAGLTIAEEGAAYAYAALHYDFRLGDSWFLTPVFAAGAFRDGGNLDLGYALEFKTGVELSFRLAGRWRIGLLGYHLSNAGLSADNPGTEAVELLLAIPVGPK
jgi:hypothetical protein